MNKFPVLPRALPLGELSSERETERARTLFLFPQPLIASGGPESANGLEDLH